MPKSRLIEMIPRAGADKIIPINQEIDVHSNAEKFELLILINFDVRPWYLQLMKQQVEFFICQCSSIFHRNHI